jgi:hypothetical protein
MLGGAHSANPCAARNSRSLSVARQTAIMWRLRYAWSLARLLGLGRLRYIFMSFDMVNPLSVAQGAIALLNYETADYTKSSTIFEILFTHIITY